MNSFDVFLWKNWVYVFISFQSPNNKIMMYFYSNDAYFTSAMPKSFTLFLTRANTKGDEYPYRVCTATDLAKILSHKGDIIQVFKMKTKGVSLHRLQ